MSTEPMPNFYIDMESRATVDLTNPGEMVPGSMTITRIIVGDEDKRGMGFGSQLLKQVCQDADRTETILSLEINPYGALTYEELRDWYTRYGFFEATDWPGVYLRVPGAPIRPVHEGFPV